jgi:hypothetical protein
LHGLHGLPSSPSKKIETGCSVPAAIFTSRNRDRARAGDQIIGVELIALGDDGMATCRS